MYTYLFDIEGWTDEYEAQWAKIWRSNQVLFSTLFEILKIN